MPVRGVSLEGSWIAVRGGGGGRGGGGWGIEVMNDVEDKAMQKIEQSTR